MYVLLVSSRIGCDLRHYQMETMLRPHLASQLHSIIKQQNNLEQHSSHITNVTPAGMDQLQISPEAIQSLSPKDRQDLNQFIQGESQKAQIQQTVHGLTGE